MRRTKTETIITALRILAAEIQSGDGVANAALREAADRMAKLHATATRQCVWTREADYHGTYDTYETYETACGARWGFAAGDRPQKSTKYCPHCGGRITLAKRPA